MDSVQELSSFIDEFVQVFDAWCGETETTAKKLGHDRTNYLTSANQKIQTLKDHEERAIKEAIKIKAVQDKENIEIGELSQAVQKLKAIEDSLPTEIQLKSKEHKELLAKISQESKKLAQKNETMTKKMNYLANIVQRYESALGLEFKPSGNQVECIFTRIDPSDASRKFIFTLSLSLDDKYKIGGASPAVNEKELRHLEDKANRTNNLDQLMKGMRELFKNNL